MGAWLDNNDVQEGKNLQMASILCSLGILSSILIFGFFGGSFLVGGEKDFKVGLLANDNFEILAVEKSSADIFKSISSLEDDLRTPKFAFVVKRFVN